MGSVGEDISSELHMMMDAYKKLRARDPGNSLLTLVTVHPDEGGFDFTEEFSRRCVRETDQHTIHGYMRYTSALQAAIDGEPVLLLDTKPPCNY